MLFKRLTEAIESVVVAHPRREMMMCPARPPIEGGLPLVRKGQYLGAIGNSGVRSFEDVVLAAAGVALFDGIRPDPVTHSEGNR